MLTVTKRHTIAAAHRLYDYNGKCERLHGHNYIIEVTCTKDELDAQGMVLDFAHLKKCLMSELDAIWDHKTLLFDKDPLCQALSSLLCDGSVVPVPFNPTAENMAMFLGAKFFPAVITKYKLSSDLHVTKVTVFETKQNSATWVQNAPHQ